METINHEYYVSLEVAKLLKEVGFDWEVKAYYRYLSPYDEYNLEFDSISTNYNHLNNADFSAPTLDVAQRWLREVKKFNIYVQKQSTADHHYFREYYFQINEFPINLIPYETYEEAQEAGIKKVLEIILEKGE